MIRQCVICGDDFDLPPTNRKTCSAVCRDTLKRQSCREAKRRYEAKNPAKRRLRFQKWKEQHPDYMREYHRRHYSANRVRIIEQNEQWKARNVKRIREYRQRYYAANREKLLATAREKQKQKQPRPPRPVVFKTCEICGGTFEAKSKSSVCPTAACRAQRQREQSRKAYFKHHAARLAQHQRYRDATRDERREQEREGHRQYAAANRAKLRAKRHQSYITESAALRVVRDLGIEVSP